MESNLTKFIDDVVPNETAKGFHSKALAQQVRAFYDCTTRAVSGKLRRPGSGCVYTANYIVNPDDKAFHSRMVTIPFKDLKCDPGEEEDPAAYNMFMHLRELMSALSVDLQQIGLWNGKLDKEAMMDWAKFLNKVLGKKRDRNINEWAKVSYIFSLLNLTFQCGYDDQVQMFAWILQTVTRSIKELTAHSNIIDQFIIQILHARENVAPNLLGPHPDKVLFWHNIRTTTHPPLYGGNQRYWAIRVPLVCHVLKQLTGQLFNVADIHAATEDSDYVIPNSKSYFYNTAKCGWPIKKSIQAIDSEMFTDVPLLEDELLDEHLERFRCIFIKESYINEIRTSLEKSSNFDVDYKTVVIKSSNKDAGEYNFFEALTGEGWFGYRSLLQSNYRTFCGGTNELQIGSPTTDRKIVSDIEMEVHTCGFNSVAECFKPEVLLEFFNYNNDTVTHNALSQFPPCYIKNPFYFRNDRDDEEPTDPLADMLTEPPSTVGTPTKSRGSTVVASPAYAGGGYTGPRTHMSPGHPRQGSTASPLAPRTGNSDDSEPQPVLKRRRANDRTNRFERRPRFIIDEADGPEEEEPVSDDDADDLDSFINDGGTHTHRVTMSSLNKRTTSYAMRIWMTKKRMEACT